MKVSSTTRGLRPRKVQVDLKQTTTYYERNKKMYGYIYETRNLINNKVYIGQHKSIEHDKKYYGSGTVIKQAIAKYGINNFTNIILDWAETKEKLDKKEKYYIKKYRLAGENMYNIAEGGYGVDPKTASIIAKKRWQSVDIYTKKHNMDKAREKYFQMLKNGDIKIPKCEECGSPINTHKKGCSKFKERPIQCEECLSRGNHKKGCSHFIPIRRSQETRNKIRKNALNRDPEYNQRISNTLKEKWKDPEFSSLYTCKECGGKSGNHKSSCSKAPFCEECLSHGHSHRKGCSKYIPPKTYTCKFCEKKIIGIGNLRQHVKKIHNKLNI